MFRINTNIIREMESISWVEGEAKIVNRRLPVLETIGKKIWSPQIYGLSPTVYPGIIMDNLRLSSPCLKIR